MKKSLLIVGTLILSLQCTELQQVANQMPGVLNTIGGIGNVTNSEIGMGLKEALNNGVETGILNLGKTDGFLKNEAVKILLPEELKQVDKTLRGIGMGAVADEGLKLLNRAAEDAVSEASPIFVNAIKGMTFQDASQILLGGSNSATNYLQNQTTTQLTAAFAPKIQNSLGKVGADKAWGNLITKYNAITGKNINPNLTGYVTEQAIKGVFTMVSQKEAGIRQNVSERKTELLQKVFALQDKK